jgi:hypothetical protein
LYVCDLCDAAAADADDDNDNNNSNTPVRMCYKLEYYY